MLIQVVHCHPLTDSYNHALFHSIVAALEDNGHQVAATDLDREQFDPAMSADERRSYYAARYDNTMGVGTYRAAKPRRWHNLLLSSLVVCDAGNAEGIFRSRLGARYRLRARHCRGRIRPLLTHIKLW
jgi:Flavodoxin-like fold